MPFFALLLLLTGAVQAHYRFSKLIINGTPEPHEWISIRQIKNFQTNSGVISVTSPDIRSFQNRVGCSTATSAACEEPGFVAISAITHFGSVQFYMAKVASISAQGSPLGSGVETWPAYQNSSVSFTVAKNTPSGKYLVRVESIALHQAQSVGGAQMYLSYAQVEVMGGGNGHSGLLVAFPGANNANDPGLRWSYYPIATSYTAPGPKIWDGN
ncbi:glycoside hydrolase family 61 protein-like protein [Ampelomyces quisqualis]|uniref:lytic cellulose monooxygenase (C4-dehydrogenating) n=1 Tax=Ampelomyces quisqualis TaxID=50730 RepID=A0A6A5Q833_AMPQU|nr:glycoside hydrolase family 61 protein-like protein [Ampelomyces quisqualis]